MTGQRQAWDLERGKPGNYLQGLFIPGLMYMSEDAQRDLAQQPCWCIGCNDIQAWEHMRWDGPLLLCQSCVHAGCDHADQAGIRDCEQVHGIQRAYWVDWGADELVHS